MKIKEWKTVHELREILNLMETLPNDVVSRTPVHIVFLWGEREVKPEFIEVDSEQLSEILYSIMGRKWHVLSKLYDYSNDETMDLPFNLDRLGVVNITDVIDNSEKTKKIDGDINRTNQESALNDNVFIDVDNEKLKQIQNEINENRGDKKSIQRSMNRLKNELIDNDYDLAYNVGKDIVNFLTYKIY